MIFSDLLRKWGISPSSLLTPRQQASPEADWSRRAFAPETGKCYEINYGFGTDKGLASVLRVRVQGSQPAEWIDMVTGEPIPAVYRGYVIVAHREIQP